MRSPVGVDARRNVEPQAEGLHSDWTAVRDRRSKEAAEGKVELLDADQVDGYVNRSRGNERYVHLLRGHYKPETDSGPIFGKGKVEASSWRF